jgi:hypothetical protein
MKVLVMIVLLSSPMLAEEVTVNIRFPGGVDKIQFDDTRFSESEIRTIFTHLSPELAPFQGYMLPEQLELCIAGDERYKPCGTRDIRSPNFLLNAEVNIRTSEERLDELKHMALPEELKLVQKYLEEFLGYGLRLERCRLEYYRTWNENVLESCDALEGAKECDAIAKKAAVVTDRLEKYKLARYDWYSCVVNHKNAQLREYPEQAWRKFLETYGIKETVFEDND